MSEEGAHPAEPALSVDGGPPADEPDAAADDDAGPAWKRALHIASPLLVIAAGVGVVLLLRATAPSPERREEPLAGALVEVVRAEGFDARPEVHAQGTVLAARRALIAPHVAGRVAWVSPELIAGGTFEDGEPLLRVDATDYRLSLAAQQGQLAQAELSLMRERSARTVAEETWALFDRSTVEATPTGRALARNLPQLQAAEEQLESARSQLAQARVNLDRTVLRAPFDARVVEESVDMGQQIGPQQPVATLAGTDAYHVRASIPVEAIPALRIPPPGAGERGSEARITQTLRGREYVWEGWVGGLLPSVDERGSMARVTVVVPDPLGLDRPEGPRAVPLLIDSFVDVTLVAEPLPEDVVQLPRAALRERDRIWIATEGGRLDIRAVDVAWRRQDTVLIASGVEPGDRVIVNRLATPVDGMHVRVVDPEADGEARLETARR